jgi:hypothetical protein
MRRQICQERCVHFLVRYWAPLPLVHEDVQHIGLHSTLLSDFPSVHLSVNQSALLSSHLLSSSASFTNSDDCILGNGGCSHQCAVAPGRGVACSCPPGLSLSPDSRTCQTLDYCSRHLKCSQVCEQYKATVKCSCYPGWRLELDGDSCQSTGSWC